MNNDKKDKKNVLNLDKAFDKAERNARERDFKIEKERFKEDHRGVEKEHFEEAMRTLSYASGKDIFIGTKRSIQSKTRFAQFLQKNWEYLRKENYLTSEEKVFLTDIQCNISMHSNAIVDDIMKKPPNALTIQVISELLGTSRSKVSRVVNSLIKKGIFAKSVTGTGDSINVNQAKDYVLFVNPNIIYVGDRDDLQEHLILMFKNQMKKNLTLLNLPQKLF